DCHDDARRLVCPGRHPRQPAPEPGDRRGAGRAPGTPPDRAPRRHPWPLAPAHRGDGRRLLRHRRRPHRHAAPRHRHLL
ncbi:MAG: hypothetical protein AVDCRST_MAG49-991, partial [uncultured Thermomicrobiales bacterium]